MVFSSRRLAFIIGFTMMSTAVCEEKRLKDYLDLPPLFQRHFGNPRIVVKAAKAEGVVIGPSPSRTKLVVKADSPDRAKAVLADALLNRAYKDFLKDSSRSFEEKRMKMFEMVPMTREDFYEVGRARLSGKAGKNRVHDAWWKVRMDMPLQRSRTHQFVMINIHSDIGKDTVGHFCFGLRRKGGDAHEDFTFDFRAPWLLDRGPTLSEGLNLKNELDIQVTTENLYDWIYTQTEYRGCFSKCWFVSVSVEQMIVMRDFIARGGTHQAGKFRGLQKNCASLGVVFFNRLVPLDQEIPVSDIADFPVKTLQNVIATFSEEPMFVRIENVTEKMGREVTGKSETHRAQPSRASSTAFRRMRSQAGIKE